MVVLGLLLAVQLFLAQRARNSLRMRAGARWCKPSATSPVAAMPAWREPGAFAMLARDVIAVPAPGVLRVQASIRNDARWPQPWPRCALAWPTPAGACSVRAASRPPTTSVARRARRPWVGQAAQLAFDIAEPGAGVVAFDFRFE